MLIMVDNEQVDVQLMDQLTETNVPDSSRRLIKEAIKTAKMTGKYLFCMLGKASEGKNGFVLKMTLEKGSAVHINDPNVPPWP